MKDYKLHVVATANQNVKIDAYWFGVGDKIDYYLTPSQFKGYINAFEDWDIIPPKEKEVVEDEIIIDEVVDNEVHNDTKNAIKSNRQNKSKTRNK